MIPFMLLLLSYNCAIFTSASNDQEKYSVASKDQKTYKVPESPPIIIQSSPSSFDTSPVVFRARHLELMRKNSRDVAEKRLEKKEKATKAELKNCMLIIAALPDNALEGLKKKATTSVGNPDEDSDDSAEKSSSSDGDLFNMEL